MTPEKFWSRADRSGGPESCWTWHGTISPAGYGRYSYINGRAKFAHRLAYELVIGPIPEGLPLDHLCRNTRCVNPAHLEAVTTRENVLRSTSPSALHAKKTHCPQGHPYDARRASGQRICRACVAARQRAYYRRNAERIIRVNGEYKRAHRKAHNPKAEIAGDLA